MLGMPRAFLRNASPPCVSSPGRSTKDYSRPPASPSRMKPGARSEAADAAGLRCNGPRTLMSLEEVPHSMPQIQPTLDHTVINVLGELDSISAQYKRLGFSLTDRGHHTLGSSNHLAIFGENYLELLGYEPGRGTER